MIRTLAQAARYIDRVGFCLLFPSKKLPLPSLIEASKGRALRNYKPCADWSGDFVRLWRWKDELPRKRLAYYGKYFRGRGVFLSLEFLAYFYCLEGNPARLVGSDAFEQLYREGKITADAHAVCAALAKRGPQATLELRYGLGWEAKRSNRRFKRALLELQRRLLIVHWGTKAETRAWESAVYQLTARAFPKAMRAAAKLSPDVARQRIAAQYRKHRAHAKPQEIARLFGWSRAEAQAALDS